MAVNWKNGRLIIDYRPDGRYGRRIRLKLPESIQDKKEAEAIEHDLLSSRKSFAAPAAVHTGATVNDLFPSYLIWYEMQRAKSTFADLQNIYGRHISRILGEQKVTEIGQEHFTLYQRLRRNEVSINSLRERAAASKRSSAKKTVGSNVISTVPNLPPPRMVKNRTINKELDYFSGFLRWCRRKKGLAVERPEVEKLPTTRPIPIVLTAEEILRILKNSSPMHRAFYLCLYTMGLRVNEARQLRWEDVDFQGMTARMVQKGGSFKLLPLNIWLAAALKEFQENGADDPPGEKSGNDAGYIFFNERSKKPLGNIRDALATSCRKAGVTKKVTPHLFRHSWATHLMGAGVNMSVIQKFMGHARIGTTEFYTHVDVEVMRGAAYTYLERVFKLLPQNT